MTAPTVRKIPRGIYGARQTACIQCPAPCSWQHDDAAHSEPANACPSGHWPRFGKAAPTGLRGLGDAVALIAGPIGKSLNLDPEKCGCAKRQAWLNNKVPF